MPDLRAVEDICKQAGIVMSDSSVGIGRELVYRDGALRTVVVHLVEADIPEVLQLTLACILSVAGPWMLFARSGDLRAREFAASDAVILAAVLVESWTTVEQQYDDLYVLATDGSVIVTFGHHLLDEGLVVELADMAYTNALLVGLNEIGAEFELISGPEC